MSELDSTTRALLRMARELDKFVITATHMMESMINTPVPTRAEVSDVANAVLDGTDAVMTSAETAAGRFPVETVEAMAAICIEAEHSVQPRDRPIDVRTELLVRPHGCFDRCGNLFETVLLVGRCEFATDVFEHDRSWIGAVAIDAMAEPGDAAFLGDGVAHELVRAGW